MMKNSDKLAISRLVATRYDLQSRTTNENNPIYEEACIAFNDYSIPTGGLISNHQAYIEKNINPDLPNLSGLLTSNRAFNIIKELANKYAEIAPRINASGHHSNDMWTYTQDVDILYAHEWLQKIGNPQLERFLSEGNQIPYYFESDDASNSSVSTPDIKNTSTTPRKERKRKMETVIATYLQDTVKQRNLQLNQANQLNVEEKMEKLSKIIESLTNQIHSYDINNLDKNDPFYLSMIRNRSRLNQRFETLSNEMLDEI